MQREVLSLILGGGRGTRLYPLTMLRSKPAVPIGGKYRLIDIPISNCINSGLKRIFVLTQFNSASLNRHVTNSYRFDPFNGGQLLTKADCIKYLQRGNYSLSDDFLTPVSARRIFMRICSNLHQIYTELGQAEEIARLQHYLVALAR